MKPKHLRTLACAGALLAGLLALAGCSSVNSSETRDPVARPDYVPDKRITSDGGLAKKFQIISVNRAEVGGILKIQVTGLNTTNSAKTVNYKFDWFDAEGMVVANSPWQSLRIQGRETVEVVGVAPNEACKDYRLKFQEP